MRTVKKLIYALLTLAIVSLPFISWWKAQAIMDWWKLRDYTPPAAISELASQDTMKSYTKHMFYLNHPQLVSGVANFRQNDCPENEDTIVLGCYHTGQNGIYIYQVSDSKLYGVEQVTAAHEVLHAVYARLSTSDRNQLNSELEDFYKNDLKDPRVLAEVKLYQQTEPNAVYDEMSCTFGTEVASLPKDLSDYYARYFSNRSAIVAFEQNYESELTGRQNQISAYDAKLAIMKTNIDNEEQSLQNQSAKINSDRAKLDSEKSSGDYQDYNAGVPAFNSEVNAYNAGVQKLQSDINAYNALVNSRNAIAKDLESLQSELDTRLTKQPAQ